jgi:hypothetical protein
MTRELNPVKIRVAVSNFSPVSQFLENECNAEQAKLPVQEQQITAFIKAVFDGSFSPPSHYLKSVFPISQSG